MIAVGGFNTAVDKLLEVDELVSGAVIRARDVRAWPGGKGAHAAICAAVLGERVRLAGVIDAAHHEWFASWLAARMVEFHGVEIQAPVRTCFTIRDGHGRTTEIREPGPAIDVDVWRTVAADFKRLCGDATVAVLSGSVPPGVPETAYRDLVCDLSGVRLLVDAGGDLLRLATEAVPFCIKPNRDEAEALTRLTLDSPAAAARAVRALASTGIRLVIVSLGPQGAVACWENRTCQLAAPAVRPLNAVGAGDCLLAGIAVGFARGYGIEDVLRLAIAAGTAKVLSPEIGLVRGADIDEVLPSVRLTWLD